LLYGTNITDGGNISAGGNDMAPRQVINHNYVNPNARNEVAAA
jgi:hypothetical protein